METTLLYQKLEKVFRDVFDDDEIVIAPETTASDIDGWDSLKQVRLLLSVEKAFRVRFSASEASGLGNVGELSALIQSKVS